MQLEGGGEKILQEEKNGVFSERCRPLGKLIKILQVRGDGILRRNADKAFLPGYCELVARTKGRHRLPQKRAGLRQKGVISVERNGCTEADEEKERK